MSGSSTCILVLLACTSVIASARGDAQTVSFDAGRLKPFTISGMVYAVRGTDTVPAGSYVQELTMYEDHLVFVTASLTRLFGQAVDTIIDHIPDLQPIAYYERSRWGVSRVDFQGAQATGSSMTPDGKSTPISFSRALTARTMPSLSLVLQATDLRDGLTFTLPMFNPVVDSTTVMMEATVTGHELVKGHSCWKIRVAVDSGGQKITLSTLWIDEVTNTLRRGATPVGSHLTLLQESSRELPRAQRAP